MKNWELLRRGVCMQGVWAIGIVGVLFTGFATATQVRTECIGNNGDCGPDTGFTQFTSAGPIEWLGVSWDGDKVRGISFRYFDNPVPINEGDVYPGPYGNTDITFLRGETLTSLTFKDSGYGYNSLRRLELSTRNNQVFTAGPDGYDNVVVASGVGGTQLSGFYGFVNPDNFMQSLGAFIMLPDAAPATGLALNTEFIGNNFQPWSGGFADQYGNYPVQWLGVRWDGDKVRGLSFRLFINGQKFTEGDFSKQYDYSEIYFSPGEKLVSLTLKDSGYGYGSLRRIEMTTSLGQTFSAGPEGFDSVRAPAVAGATLVGYFGLVNVDNFMQSLGAVVVYPDCSGTLIVLDDESTPTTPVTDLTGLAGPEALCSTTQITCEIPTGSGNRRLLLGTTESAHRRILIDDVTTLTIPSTDYGYFIDTVSLWDLDRTDYAPSSTATLFTNPNPPATLSWRIDRQQSTVINNIRYNVLAVQGGPSRQRGQTYASVLVPINYSMGYRRIRNAFMQSQREGRTLVLGPEGGYATQWESFVRNNALSLAPPQAAPPPGYNDDRSSGYIRTILWLLTSRNLLGGQGCRP